MKYTIRHSLDIQSAINRIEKNKVDPYCVHIEDYENVNDLIARSIRTKTKFTPEHVPGAEYDTDKKIAELLSEQPIIDQMPTSGQTESPISDDAKRSDGKSENISDKVPDEEALPLG